MPRRSAVGVASALSRRVLLQHGGIGLVGAALAGASLRALRAAAPAEGPVAPGSAALTPLNRLPRTVQEYCVRRVRDVERAANERRAALRTRADAEAYVRDVRAKIQRCFGPWPEKTPLHARVTGVVRRDGYAIEKVLFESRPGFLVTGNAYVATGRGGRLPAVLVMCGHSENGKASESEQAIGQTLARLGYVALVIDPIGQGERVQHVTADLRPRHGSSVNEHCHVGIQMVPLGGFSGSWFAWDGIRALDYLLERPDVDPARLGVTGNSGGGTQTTWVLANDSRPTMGAPNCFLTSFRRNLENETLADSEQCPPGALALGLDHSDFIAAYAPRPVLVLGQEKDIFDARAVEETFARLQGLYRLLGAEENIALFMGPGYHGYFKENRAAMYGWFNRLAGLPPPGAEPPFTIENDETLWCTPRGQVGGIRSRMIWHTTNETAREWQRKRQRARESELREAILAALKMPPRVGVADYRILRRNNGRGYPREFSASYAVETEPDVHAFVYRLHHEVLYARPPRGPTRAVLYVSHRSADEELREEPLLKELAAAEPEAAFFTCDVRGIGESKPAPEALGDFGMDFWHAAHGLMLDYSTPGQRTFDVLRVLDWLREQGHREVHLVAKGWGAIPATFAAVLHELVTQVTLKNALTSYTAICEAADYRWPLAAMVPGILKSFDLPDCYRVLARKKLRQVEPWDEMARLV